MIIKQELVRRIKEQFNLNIYETKVWLALLSKGIASAGEVAEISEVPRSRTYDVLESLEKIGFAITKIGKPVKYIAVKPTEVIEKMKSRTLQEAHDKVKSLSELRGTSEYTELEELHNNGISPIKSQDLTGSIKGRGNIITRVKELVNNAEKELIICTSVKDFKDKSRIILPLLLSLDDSIKLKMALSGDKEEVKRLNGKHGLKIKYTDSKARVFVADKSELLFMITPDNAEEHMAVWLQSPYFAESLTKMLEKGL